MKSKDRSGGLPMSRVFPWAQSAHFAELGTVYLDVHPVRHEIGGKDSVVVAEVGELGAGESRRSA